MTNEKMMNVKEMKDLVERIREASEGRPEDRERFLKDTKEVQAVYVENCSYDDVSAFVNSEYEEIRDLATYLIDEYMGMVSSWID